MIPASAPQRALFVCLLGVPGKEALVAYFEMACADTPLEGYRLVVQQVLSSKAGTCMANYLGFLKIRFSEERTAPAV